MACRCRKHNTIGGWALLHTVGSTTTTVFVPVGPPLNVADVTEISSRAEVIGATLQLKWSPAVRYANTLDGLLTASVVSAGASTTGSAIVYFPFATLPGTPLRHLQLGYEAVNASGVAFEKGILFATFSARAI